MRRAAKVDANQQQIVKALRKVGASVQSLAAIGDGCPDLAVGYRGKNLLLEVKQPKGKLTEDQEKFHREWKGDLCVVRSVDEALLLLGIP